jgi:hypothetical protein
VPHYILWFVCFRQQYTIHTGTQTHKHSIRTVRETHRHRHTHTPVTTRRLLSFCTQSRLEGREREGTTSKRYCCCCCYCFAYSSLCSTLQYVRTSAAAGSSSGSSSISASCTLRSLWRCLSHCTAGHCKGRQSSGGSLRGGASHSSTLFFHLWVRFLSAVLL